MDEFGVLTERYGLKPQGKAAPMASSKRTTASNNFNSSGSNVSFDFSQSKANKKFGALDDYADIFGGSKGNTDTINNGVSFGFDSGLKTSKSNSYGYGDQDDIFGGLTGLDSSSSNKKSDDVFRSFASPPNRTSPIDDLLGGFNNSGNDDDVFVFSNNHSGTTSNGSVNGSKNQSVGGFDDLIPGFGPPDGGSASDCSGASIPQQSATRSAKSNSVLPEDPFVVLESTSEQMHTSSVTSSDPLEEFGNFRGANNDVHKEKSPDATSIDELEAFAMGGFKKNANAKTTNGKIAKAVSAGDVKVAAERINVNIKTVPKPSQRSTSGSSSKMKKASSATNIADDLFGDASFFGGFDEVEGESEERRRARLGRQGRTQQRVAKAVAEMNHREFQTQQEQEERRRIAETLDAEIKRWAAGKEGNMRALLSSLQQVIWPESGWEPVSLTDLITSTSVKKVYRKATLCVHPDKVQQKGASLQQKYIAEKVFDILKEAYMKFSTEELR